MKVSSATGSQLKLFRALTSDHSATPTRYLVHLVHTILNNLEEPKTWPNLVLVDFQKASDLVGHNILIHLLSDNFELDPLLLWVQTGAKIAHRHNLVASLSDFSCSVEQLRRVEKLNQV